jgi:hypothetical protein
MTCSLMSTQKIWLESPENRTSQSARAIFQQIPPGNDGAPFPAHRPEGVKQRIHQIAGPENSILFIKAARERLIAIAALAVSR